MATELSGKAGETVVLAAEDQGKETTGHFDVGAVHLVSSHDLVALSRVVGTDTASAIERFRPNILIDHDSLVTSKIENGRQLAIGNEVLLEAVGPTDRCVMVSMAQQELPAENEVLKSIVREFGGNFGCYLKPVKMGAVQVGDEVRLC